MFNLYCAAWCPDCRLTVQYLDEHSIPYHYFDIESIEQDILQKCIDANGGSDWSVPTFEKNGHWIVPGTMDNAKIEETLKTLLNIK